MNDKQALALLEKTADKLKKDGYNLLLFASKPTSKTAADDTKESIVGVMEASKPSDLIAALSDWILIDTRFASVFLTVIQQAKDVLAESTNFEDNRNDKIAGL